MAANDIKLGDPGIANPVLKRGASLSLAVTFTRTSDGSAVDLSGLTFLSQVRRDTSSRSKSQATITVTLDDSINNILHFASDEVASLDEGDYKWDVWCVELKRFILEGEFTVEGSVTRG